MNLVNNSQKLFPELVYPEFIEGKGNFWLNIVNPSTPCRYAALRSGDKTSLFTKLANCRVKTKTALFFEAVFAPAFFINLYTI